MSIIIPALRNPISITSAVAGANAVPTAFAPFAAATLAAIPPSNIVGSGAIFPNAPPTPALTSLSF